MGKLQTGRCEGVDRVDRVGRGDSGGVSNGQCLFIK